MHQYQETNRTMGANILASLLVAVIGFFVVSAILMSVWNYVIPRLAHSVVKDYKYTGLASDPDEVRAPPGAPYTAEESDWTNIDYPTAMVFLILLSMMFAPFAIFREWRVDRVLRKMEADNEVPSTHIGSGATIENMRARRASSRRSLGTVV